MADGVLTTRDYKLNALKLVTSSGANIDLDAIFVELQIFQDMYSSVMNGELLINDSKDIFSNFVLCGNDYLMVSIDKPSLNLPLEKVFRVYKVTNRSPVKSDTQVYTLHFCSDELITSNSMKISKSYKDMKTSDIVSDVLTNHLKVDKSKISYIEDTAGTYDYVVPYCRPFEIIQWATARSYNTDPKFCYFFYENTDGYVFKSLQSHYSQKPYKKIKYEVKSTSTDPADNKDSADDFTIINDFDILTGVSNGAFASRLLAVDVFSRSYQDYTYDLETAEEQLLNKNKQVNNLKNPAGDYMFSAVNSYFTTYIQINDTTSEKENSIDKWMLPRALHMSTINSFRIKMILPGDIALKAGNLVDVIFPKIAAADESGKGFDKYRSCKYLVTSINHKFSDDNFVTIVELSTDSFAEKLPSAKDLTNLLKKKI